MSHVTPMVQRYIVPVVRGKQKLKLANLEKTAVAQNLHRLYWKSIALKPILKSKDFKI